MAYQRLCSLFDIPPAGGKLFLDALGTKEDVVVFKTPDGVVAYHAHCPHAGALLRPENEMGGKLYCFLHQWEFDVATGACATAPHLPLRPYPIKVEGMHVLIDFGDNVEAEGAPEISAPSISLKIPRLKPVKD